ncbi:3-hydroxyacyl-CoA dehydrogenase family protein [Piscibacillus halophilus]|nr:3-hydroxyacyl-CoA dehydrogenase family protein [Piscibacillus halophilus]
MKRIEKVGVVGSGTMGAQIAMVCAMAGYQVVLQDIQKDRLKKAEESLHFHMNNRIAKGKLTEEEVEKAFRLLTYTTSLEDFQDVDFVIEAIVEKLSVKRDVFAELDQITPQHTILATNSSTIVSSKIASATNRPEKVCNTHFFNPPLVMELVEVVCGEHTSAETADTAFQFIKNINKLPVLLNKEISGFVANRILGALLDEAVYLLENDYASHEEIDLIVQKALKHPIGPFALLDLTGLDVSYYVKQERYEETGLESDRPSKLIEQKVKNGELGRKTGKGFYSYQNKITT